MMKSICKKVINFGLALSVSAALTGCAGVQAADGKYVAESYYELLGLMQTPLEKQPVELTGKYADFLLSYQAAITGDFGEALENMQALVAKEPDSIYLQNELGALYLQKGELVKAADVLENAVRHEPIDVETLLLLGPVYHGLNRFQDAIAVYERAVKLPKGKENAEVYFILAKLYMDADRLNDAKKLIEDGTKSFKDNFAFYYILGEIYVEGKEYNRAEEAYKKTLRLEPNFFEARFALADLYRATKRTNDLINTYSDILAFEPENIPAMMGLSLAYRDAKRTAASHEMMATLAVQAMSTSLVMSDLYGIYVDPGNYEDAIYLINGILQVAPNAMDIRYLAALCEQNMGNNAMAQTHYGKITPDSTFYANAVMQSALLYNQAGDSVMALRVLRDAMVNIRNNEELYFFAGLFAADQKLHNEAEEYYLKALDLNSNNIQYMLQYAMLLERTERQEEAIALMRKVLGIDPENSSALNYIGYVYADKGVNLDEAEILIKRALNSSPNDGYIVDSLGWVYYQKGDYGLALEYLQKAYEMQPGDPVISEHLGDVYVKLNEPEKAKTHYEKALELDKDKERYDLVFNKLNAIK